MRKLILLALVLSLTVGTAYCADSSIVDSSQITENRIKPVRLFSDDMKRVITESDIYNYESCDRVIELFLKCLDRDDLSNAQLLSMNYGSVFINEKKAFPPQWQDLINKQYPYWKQKTIEFPHNADYYAVLSSFLYNKKDFSKAIYYAKMAQKYNPEKYAKLVGSYYFVADMYDMAREEYLKQLKEFPNNYNIMYSLFVIASIQNNYAKLIDYGRTLIGKNTQYKSYTMLTLYWGMKKRSFPKMDVLSLLVAPESIGNYINQLDILYLKSALYMLKCDQPGTAVNMIKDSYEINRNNYDYYMTAVSRLINKNEREDAEEIFGLIDYNNLNKAQKHKYNILQNMMK